MYSDKSVKNNFWDLGNDNNGLQTATGIDEISDESDLNFNENIIKKKMTSKRNLIKSLSLTLIQESIPSLSRFL